MTPEDDGLQKGGREMTVEDLVSKDMKPRQFNGSWISNTKLLIMDSSGGLSIVDFSTNETQILMPNNTFRQLNSNQYSVSADLNYVLIAYDSEMHKSKNAHSKYKLYSVKSGTQSDVKLGGPNRTDLLQWIWWSTAGRAAVAVSDNDLFYIPDITKSHLNSRRLTNTGLFNTIYNGLTDRLYKDLILHSPRAVWFSPSGDQLLFASFNYSKVGTVTLREFETDLFVSKDPMEYQTQCETKIRYSKAGLAIPSFTFFVVNLTSNTSVIVSPPRALENSDCYFTSSQWIDDNDILIVWTNRLQNLSMTSLCSKPDFKCIEIYREEAPGGFGWVESRPGCPRISKDKKSLVTIRPIQDSPAGYFAQVVRVDIDNLVVNNNAISLTHGKFETTEIVNWDEDNKVIFYISTLMHKPESRHLFRLYYNDNLKVEVKNECLTCHPDDFEFVEREDGKTFSLKPSDDYCDYVKIHMSSDCSFYILECLGSGIPTAKLFSLPNNTFVKWLDHNDELRERIAEIKMPQIRYMTVPLPGSKVPAHVQLLLPAEFRDYEEQKFPLLIHLQDEPGRQFVDAQWKLTFDHYLSSAEDFVVALVAVHGSSAYGEAFKHAVFRQLGVLETKDSLNVLKYLIKKIDYIDSDRVAVWGHGHGGHLAIKAMAEDKDRVVNCGIAVAPITKWQNYESYLSERFMSSTGPHGNWRGYEESDLNSKVMDLHGQNIFVIHGAGKDLIHHEQSMSLVKALVEANVLFRQQVYPYEETLLPDIMKHLFLSMFDFLHADCFLSNSLLLSRRYYLEQKGLMEDASPWNLLQYWNS